MGVLEYADVRKMATMNNLEGENMEEMPKQMCAVEQTEKAVATGTGVTTDLLRTLGLTAAASKIDHLKSLKRKMMVAYEHYRYLTPEKIEAFNKKLYARTFDVRTYMYQRLSMTALEHYTEVPPADVLAKLQEALDRKCFDRYEVAHIVTEVKIPDPLLLGIINGCKDKFFVAQWDTDIAIEDILKEHEG